MSAIGQINFTSCQRKLQNAVITGVNFIERPMMHNKINNQDPLLNKFITQMLLLYDGV